MNPIFIGVLVFASSMGAALFALWLSARLPGHHRNAESKDTVKVAMGLVATMTALVLGMLVASAKGSFDTQKGEVTAMAAKIAFLDRMLGVYGPEAAAARQSLHEAGERLMDHLWQERSTQGAQNDPSLASAEAAYRALEALSPKNDEQRAIRSQALSIAYDFGQIRWQLVEQGGTSISTPMLVIVIGWITVLFLSFGLFAPPNATIILSLAVAALAVAGAIFLILELDQPFVGLISISKQPMINALSHEGN